MNNICTQQQKYIYGELEQELKRKSAWTIFKNRLLLQVGDSKVFAWYKKEAVEKNDTF